MTEQQLFLYVYARNPFVHSDMYAKIVFSNIKLVIKIGIKNDATIMQNKYMSEAQILAKFQKQQGTHKFHARIRSKNIYICRYHKYFENK